jgi:3-oxoacyl-[acyl-carrier protein] reductase
MAFTGKVVLVTGGGRGIGRATALAFGAQGAKVVITSRTEKELQAVRKEIEAQGGDALAVAADVSSPKSVTGLIAKAVKKFGALDVLVNNAGVLEPIGPVWQTKPSAWRKNIHVNLDGIYLCSRAVLPSMMEHKDGAIINVSSGAARNARYGWSAYCASKAAIDQLTRVMAVELKPYNVRVNAVYPGITETRMQQMIRATDDDLMGGDAQVFRDRHTHGLSLPPEMPAQLIVWLAQQSDFSGQILDINDPDVKRRVGLG